MEDILRVQAESFPKEEQASKLVIWTRALMAGHEAFGFYSDEKLLAYGMWRYGSFDADVGMLPQTWSAFADLAAIPTGNAAFLYTLAIPERHRTAEWVFHELPDFLALYFNEKGIRYIVGPVRASRAHADASAMQFVSGTEIPAKRLLRQKEIGFYTEVFRGRIRIVQYLPEFFPTGGDAAMLCVDIREVFA